MRDLLPSVIVAPMAGGPSTAELVIGAGRAGALGFLAAGYKTPGLVEDELRLVGLAGLPFGLNIFVPAPPPADLEPLERYRRLLQPEADRYEVELPPLRPADDDHFAAKVELAAAYRVPLVSFTFGVPDAAAVRRLRAAGCAVLVTVTNAAEAARALAAAPDALICQAGTAGGHAATTDPAAYRGTSTAPEALAAVRRAADVSDRRGRRHRVGRPTWPSCWRPALRRCSAAPPSYLPTRPARGRPSVPQCSPATSAPPRRSVTRAFTGQPARALRNRFTDAYTAVAPVGYPAVHHLTAPIRAAAARRGDAGALNLWAGTGLCRGAAAPRCADRSTS